MGTRWRGCLSVRKGQPGELSSCVMIQSGVSTTVESTYTNRQSLTLRTRSRCRWE